MEMWKSFRKRDIYFWLAYNQKKKIPPLAAVCVYHEKEPRTKVENIIVNKFTAQKREKPAKGSRTGTHKDLKDKYPAQLKSDYNDNNQSGVYVNILIKFLCHQRRYTSFR